MIFKIYKKALSVLMKKPFHLWGISLLAILLDVVGNALFGIIPGVGIAISWLLTTSMTLIYLHGYRGEEVRSVQLFDCFRDWVTIKRVLCGMGWMALWIFLWCLIPIVGPIFAIIRTYEYRLTPYILMQEPDVAITDAIKVSKERTKGWKGKMFGADILYWVFLGIIFVILLLLCKIPVIKYLFIVVIVLLFLCVIAFSALYLGLVRSAFYEEIMNPEQPAPAGNFCVSCGAEIPEGSAFCPFCGSIQSAAPAEEAPAAEAEPSDPNW